VAGLAAGCGDDAPGNHLPTFNDITSAPPAIQTAAAAVVRIATANASATGSFISPSGLLLTNNHVLGAEVCPLEGCSVQLRFMFQRGHAVTDTLSVTAVPVAVDVGLDVAIVQISMAGGPLATPDYLEIRGQDSTALVGQHVTVVGHPEGRLKKWTDGVVFDAFGDWFRTTAFSLPGNSGSPILDDAGKLVGILHRGPTTLDLITQDSVDVYSIATSSASILAAQAAPLPSVMISLGAATTADKVVADNVVYQNGGARTAVVGASNVAVLDLLAQACDAALARTDFVSPDDLSQALQPCADGQNWIECQFDASPVPYARVCPDDSARAQWADRFRQMNQQWVEMNGNTDLFPVSFGIAALQTDHGSGQIAGAAEMMQALTAAQQPLDFSVANYLAAFAIDSYAGARSLDWLRAYDSRPGWAHDAYSIASAFLWWRDDQIIDDTELLKVLDRLDHDPDADTRAKLYVDMALYFRNR
jgi:V8-like Glu-specific endopeptidase